MFRSKNHKTLIIMETSSENKSDDEALSISSRQVIFSKKEFLKMANDWWDSRGTHFNDFDDFHAISQPDLN